MSRFFRSAGSSSNSDSEPTSDSDSADLGAEEDQTAELNQDLSYFNALNVDASHDLRPVDQSSAGFNRDLLLHALLEERCLNEVLASRQDARSHSRSRRDDPGVQAEARARYRGLCSQLASYNLISTGLEHEQHASTRQWYRNGLDLLGQQQSANTVPHPLRRLLTDMDADPRHSGLQIGSSSTSRGSGSFDRPAVPLPLQRLLTGVDNAGAAASPQMHIFGTQNQGKMSRLFEKRYRIDFEELSTLGRGGYGIVYHVRHRVDNQVYAVKKVPLKASRLQQIQTRGQAGLDEILLETRTLARLSHPNIVKYHNSWIEWVDVGPDTGLRQSNGDGHTLTDEPDVVLGAQDSRDDSVRRVLTESDADGTDIVFEDSGAMQKSTMWEDSTGSVGTFGNNSSVQLPEVGTQNTTRTNGCGTVESVRQHTEPSASKQSTDGIAPLKEPVLALHMQMSVHPMTLADFTSTIADPAVQRNTLEAVPRLRHCYHVEPSINILLAILDGIDYLHSEGIVHRDIKPANIFLGANHNPRSTRGSVDLLLCSDCRADGRANAISISVCIGDFGLVAFADPEAQMLSESTAVGTEIYRPAISDPRSPGLDIYALGIVFFELLWKFDTIMERYHTIQQLKRGKYPPKFAQKPKECIDVMLSQGSGESISIRKLKQMISAIPSPSEQSL